jgi:hypothetical protein
MKFLYVNHLTRSNFVVSYKYACDPANTGEARKESWRREQNGNVAIG